MPAALGVTERVLFFKRGASQPSAGKSLENLAIAIHHRPQPLAEPLVLPLARDVLGDRLAHGISNTYRIALLRTTRSFGREQYAPTPMTNGL